MTRRALLLLPFAGLLRAKQQPPQDISVLANQLAESYNAWARAMNAITKKVERLPVDMRPFAAANLSFDELKALWHKQVKPEFHALDKIVAKL